MGELGITADHVLVLQGAGADTGCDFAFLARRGNSPEPYAG
ncbi:hypothetical protein ACFYWY_18550 [Streptomyces sp. NPDC002870]